MYYVYSLHSSLEPDTLFYVGKTREMIGSRFDSHRRAALNSKSKLPIYYKWRKIIRSGGKVYEKIIKKFEIESDAFSFEKELVLKIGRRVIGTGPLLNLTEGGFGGEDLSSLPKDYLQRRAKIIVAKVRKRYRDKYKNSIAKIKFSYNLDMVISRLKNRDYNTDLPLLWHMYNDCNMSLGHICRYLKNSISTSSVSNKFKEMGYSLRDGGPAVCSLKLEDRYRIFFTEDQKNKIIKCYKIGIGCDHIAKYFNVAIPVINRLLKKNGVVLRDTPLAITLSHKLKFAREELISIIMSSKTGREVEEAIESVEYLYENNMCHISVITISKISKILTNSDLGDKVVYLYKMGIGADKLAPIFKTPRSVIYKLLKIRSIKRRTAGASRGLRMALEKSGKYDELVTSCSP